MFLTETSLVEITKIQYLFKLKAYLNLFYGLMAAQILAMIFSFIGGAGMGSSSGNISFFSHIYSTDIIIIFTLIWIFIVSISFASDSYRILILLLFQPE